MTTPATPHSNGKSAAFVVLAVLLIIFGWGMLRYATSHVDVTTCNTVLQTCTQTVYPVTDQTP